METKNIESLKESLSAFLRDELWMARSDKEKERENNLGKQLRTVAAIDTMSDLLEIVSGSYTPLFEDVQDLKRLSAWITENLPLETQDLCHIYIDREPASWEDLQHEECVFINTSEDWRMVAVDVNTKAAFFGKWKVKALDGVIDLHSRASANVYGALALVSERDETSFKSERTACYSELAYEITGIENFREMERFYRNGEMDQLVDYATTIATIDEAPRLREVHVSPYVSKGDSLILERSNTFLVRDYDETKELNLDMQIVRNEAERSFKVFVKRDENTIIEAFIGATIDNVPQEISEDLKPLLVGWIFDSFCNYEKEQYRLNDQGQDSELFATFNPREETFTIHHIGASGTHQSCEVPLSCHLDVQGNMEILEKEAQTYFGEWCTMDYSNKTNRGLSR